MLHLSSSKRKKHIIIASFHEKLRDPEPYFQNGKMSGMMNIISTAMSS